MSFSVSTYEGPGKDVKQYIRTGPEVEESGVLMSTTGTPKTAAEIQQDWDTNPRWKGVTRNYTAEQVTKLQAPLSKRRPSHAVDPRSSGTS